MASPAFEVAEVFRRHGDAYRRDQAGRLGRVERRVMSAIEICRTAALGGHVEACDDCGVSRVAYNSCRNRHCPKCQGQAREAWLAARQSELLPVPYFHVVFTLPSAAAEIAFQNKALVYAILMRAAAEALMTLAADPKHLGAEIGLLAVLHTWGQTLTHHPHVHCVVPGGGLSPDGRRWIACRPNFFLPVHALARLFRRLFLTALETAFQGGGLTFFGSLAPLAKARSFADRIAALRQAEWVVYAKPPFGGPAQVLAYLARYTHRAAIANSRLVAIDQDKVAFAFKDYRRNGQRKVMRLDAHEFIRRFLLHVLPDGFHRIRYYGFLASGRRAQKIELRRALLKGRPSLDGAASDSVDGAAGSQSGCRKDPRMPRLRRRDATHRRFPSYEAKAVLVRYLMTAPIRHPPALFLSRTPAPNGSAPRRALTYALLAISTPSARDSTKDNSPSSHVTRADRAHCTLQRRRQHPFQPRQADRARRFPHSG